MRRVRASYGMSVQPDGRQKGSIMDYPQGRSDYSPRRRRIGDPCPQDAPERFSREDCMAEVKYLMGLNRRYGSNALRTVAYVAILTHLKERGSA